MAITTDALIMSKEAAPVEFSDDFSDGEITVVIVKPRPQPKKPKSSAFEDWGFADLTNWMQVH